MNDQTNNQTWNEGTFRYDWKFGEIRLKKFGFNGLKLIPNIFEYEAAEIVPPDLDPKACLFMYSVPCTDREVPGLSRINGYIKHIEKVYKHYYIDTSGSFEDYMQAFFRGKKLNTLKRKIKKIENSNDRENAVRIFSDSSEILEFLDIAKKISKNTYHEKLLGNELPTDDEFKNELVRLAKNESVYGFVLYAQDQPIAYNHCPVYGDGVMLYDYTGYLPEFGNFSPGTVLQFKIIEQAFQNPDIKIYDLCTGEGRHKEYFTDAYITCCDGYFFPSSIYHFGITISKYSIEKTSDLIVGLLDKLGLKERIKKFFRDHVRVSEQAG